MRPKLMKCIWGDMVDISISRFNFSKYNVSNIIDLFKYETAIIEIGNIERSSDLFRTIKELSMNYTTAGNADSLYTDAAFMVNNPNLQELLHLILDSECESFSIESVDKNIKWEQYLSERINIRKLIKRKAIKVSIAVIINESQVDITFNKDVYNTKQVMLKIKEQFL